MAAFSNDEDLLRYRPSALDHGIEELSDLHEEAHDLIIEALEATWFRDQALSHGLNPDLTAMDETRLETSRLRRLSCYKVLELLYRRLMKVTPQEDGFARLKADFGKEFDREFQRLVTQGLGYDWNYGGAITQDEKFTPQLRRLRRC
jgi:hypothetical protein